MNAVLQTNNDKRALVVGLGTTGLSCVRYLNARGFEVTGVDSRATPPEAGRIEREFPTVHLHRGALKAELFDAPGLLVVSPGVSLKEPALARAMARGTQAIGDIELFAREAKAPVLAITGSNGKSTVTALAGEMCRAAGLKALVGGNIGVPALALLDEPTPDVYVLELSSFQLETTHSLDARAATVLNLSPDHMDRYASLVDYAAAKARIFRGTGIMVLNADDPTVMAMQLPGRTYLRFGLGQPASKSDYGIADHGGAQWLARGDELIMPVAEVPLAGRHNLVNVLAAMAVSSVSGATPSAQRAAVRAFRGLPHRTQLIAERDGVQWINDSKGTNVGATVAALNGMTRRVILIAGGDGKGQDFAELRDAVAAHARAVVLIGRDARLIESVLGGVVPVIHARDMREAVQRARTAAQVGDAILLSPACASFDMFRNYEERGEHFAQAVAEVLR